MHKEWEIIQPECIAKIGRKNLLVQRNERENREGKRKRRKEKEKEREDFVRKEKIGAKSSTVLSHLHVVKNNASIGAFLFVILLLFLLLLLLASGENGSFLLRLSSVSLAEILLVSDNKSG